MSKAVTKKTQKDFIINDVLWVHENDNVGVGVSAPSARLEVTGSTANVLGVAVLNVNNLFYVSGSTANPRVGIGTATPNAALDISTGKFILATAVSGSGAAYAGTISYSVGTNGSAYLWVATGSGTTVGWVGFASTATGGAAS